MIGAVACRMKSVVWVCKCVCCFGCFALNLSDDVALRGQKVGAELGAGCATCAMNASKMNG